MRLGKRVPRTEHAKSMAEKRQQGLWVSVSSKREGIRSQDQKLVLWERDYFYTVVFLKLIPFLFFLFGKIHFLKSQLS